MMAITLAAVIAGILKNGAHFPPISQFTSSRCPESHKGKGTFLSRDPNPAYRSRPRRLGNAETPRRRRTADEQRHDERRRSWSSHGEDEGKHVEFQQGMGPFSPSFLFPLLVSFLSLSPHPPTRACHRGPKPPTIAGVCRKHWSPATARNKTLGWRGPMTITVFAQTKSLGLPGLPGHCYRAVKLPRRVRGCSITSGTGSGSFRVGGTEMPMHPDPSSLQMPAYWQNR
ncbi:hypothetical protein QBC34DRAFT_103077 [Podospora aff. communis PSN243]|uniref:Secreted protein n=1 Tax=Podospora aff. communis PSN243 TaxID=3040156 RepID=A0AAV9H4D6_9PEZI|nr:hypothetical protein QBC34DRAFT_103077 [Podospora aff. communis PSN243]